MTSVKVAVRVRPFNQREIGKESQCCIRMEGDTTYITDPKTGVQKKFTFDYSYWSHDGFKEDKNGIFVKDSPSSNYASQKMVFDDLGIDVLDNAFDGYHTWLFAYGQTGSGKSYSIFGYNKNIGIIPMACLEIFKRIEDFTKNSKVSKDAPEDANTDGTGFVVGNKRYEVTVSMLEIYNEWVHDLFVKPNKRPQGGLKIRETKDDGVYVDGLTVIPVTSYQDIADQIERGTSLRTIGATNMNATSSRAHTVTTITFNQTEYTNGKPTNKLRSNINLVDLAGSERARTTGADAQRLKEGSNINKSLSFLGKVINILADKAAGKKEAKNQVVPYRESKLTRILQNALGGNSKTAMIAALSPADINFEETLSTLVYANQVKSIKNKAKINESPEDKLIRELKEENEKLRKMFENKEAILQEIDEDKKADDDLEGKVFIMNINEDPLLTGQIKHPLNDGITRIGKPGKSPEPNIKMGGIGVTYNHNQIKYDEKTGELMLYPNDQDPTKNRTHLNGDLITKPVPLIHGDRILFGNNNLYIVIFPGKQVDDQFLDYEDAMKEILKEQMNALRDEKYQKAMEEKLKKLKEEMDKEKADLDSKFKDEQNRIDEAHRKLEEEMKRKDEELKNKLAEIGDNNDKMRELEERLRQQQEEADRLRNQQEGIEQKFRNDKNRALKELEESNIK